MLTLLKRILLGISALLVLAVLALTLLPWNKWLEAELKSRLAAVGMEQLSFTVSDVGIGGITFKSISLGDNASFVLDSLTLGYSLPELLEGRLQTLASGELIFKQNDMELRIGGLQLEPPVAQPDGTLQSNWRIRDIRISGTPLVLPTLEGKGTLLWGSVVTLAGDITSSDASHKAQFSLTAPIADTAGATFKLTALQLPWNGGMLRAKPFSIALAGKQPVPLTLVLEHVPLHALMQMLSGNKVSATGTISGDLPLKIARDGAITIGQGTLKTDDKGVISLPPDVIPGDHPQVDMVRQIMQDFHYDNFSMELRSDNPKKLSILLSLKGNNPEIYNGRMVNLNVNLTGDLLDLLQQGMITIVDPKQLLNKGQK